MTEYVECPNCKGTLLTKEYEQRYGQCKACYKPLGQKIYESFGYVSYP